MSGELREAVAEALMAPALPWDAYTEGTRDLWRAKADVALAAMRTEVANLEHPDYPEEWSDPDHPKAEFWKTDPEYWRAELAWHTAGYAEVERQRYAWLDEWQKTHTGDMMGEVEYLKLRVSGECHRSGMLAARLRLRELGCSE